MSKALDFVGRLNDINDEIQESITPEDVKRGAIFALTFFTLLAVIALGDVFLILGLFVILAIVAGIVYLGSKNLFPPS